MHILFIVVFDQIFYILDYSYLHVACAFFSLTSLAKEYSEHHTYELSGKSGIPSCRHVSSGFFYYVIIIVLRLPTLLLLLLLFRYAYILSLSCNVISTKLYLRHRQYLRYRVIYQTVILDTGFPSTLLCLFLPMAFWFFWRFGLHSVRPHGHVVHQLLLQHVLFPDLRQVIVFYLISSVY